MAAGEKVDATLQTTPHNMRQRQSLASFLEAAGKSLKSSVEGQDVVRLVIGNESCGALI